MITALFADMDMALLQKLMWCNWLKSKSFQHPTNGN